MKSLTLAQIKVDVKKKSIGKENVVSDKNSEVRAKIYISYFIHFIF